jgi:hypothetical protein
LLKTALSLSHKVISKTNFSKLKSTRRLNLKLNIGISQAFNN